VPNKKATLSLSKAHPKLAKQAYGWDPIKFKAGSHAEKEWKCLNGHIFKRAIRYHVKIQSCPICKSLDPKSKSSLLNPIYKEFLLETSGWLPEGLTAGMNVKKEWKCKEGHIWGATISNRINGGTQCPYCTRKKVLKGFNDLATEHPELTLDCDGWDPSDFFSASSRSKPWKCYLGHKWKAVIYERAIEGTGCPYCSNQKVLTGFNDLATTHPELAREAFGWDPKLIVAGTHKKLAWKCNSAHVWRAQVVNRSRQNQGCPTCADSGYDPNESGYLYLLNHSQWRMFQIGITNVPDDRMRRHKKLGWELLEIRGPIDGLLAQQLETAILRMLKAKGADLSNSKIAGKFDGYSEAWSKSTFPVKSIKELMRLTEEFEESK